MSVLINGDHGRLVIVGDRIVYDDGTLLSGYANGVPWYQKEVAEELDEPYLNSWGYRCTLAECTETDDTPLQMYKWFYRCYKENMDVPNRTIVTRSNVYSFTAMTPITSGEYSEITVPIAQFPYDGDFIDKIRYYRKIAWRVVVDNHFLTQPHYGDLWNGIAFRSRYAQSAEERDMMLSRIAASVSDIDNRINTLYGFTPDNKPSTVEDRVKVAKAIFDWMRLHNKYALEGDWQDQTMYSALSDGDRTPVCASYAHAAHYLLERYGIENIVVYGWLTSFGTDHAWLIVNYHDNIGDYTADESQWCIFDCTGNQNGTLSTWDNFNRVQTEDRYLTYYNLHYPLPVDLATDSEHRYDGSTHYGW